MSEKQYFLMSETVKDLLFENGKPKVDCFYEVNTCLICNSSRLKKLFQQWGIDYLECKECGFIFSNPRLTGKGAYLWYNSEYYDAAMCSEHFIVKNYNKYFSVSLNEILLHKFFELFNSYQFTKNSKIADIGCGSGSIIHYLRDELEFKNVVGYDLNENNAKFAKEYRKINLRMKDVFDLEEEYKFDIIITTENIEHVSDPIKYVEKISNLLTKKGFLILTTPHNDEFANKIMGKFADHYCAPNHQNFFSLNNLSLLLGKHDLNIDNYWLYTAEKFNLQKFLKRFILKREQITAIPPINASLRSIYKWGKNVQNCVNISDYTEDEYKYKNIGKTKVPSFSFKKKIKQFIKSPFPIYFKTHQILIAQKK